MSRIFVRTIRAALPALAALCLAATAQAQTVPGARKALGVDDPVARQMWSDVLPSLSGQSLAYTPMVYVSTMTDKYGRTLALSELQSGPTCGTASCSGRLFVDGKMVFDGQVCGEWEKVAFAADGTYYDDCGERVDVPVPTR